MIDSLKYEIKKILSKDFNYISENTININLIYLFNLKYLCDKGNYSYEEIIKLDNIEKLDLKEEYKLLYLGKIVVNKLLSLIQYEDLASLIKEFLHHYEKEPKFINIKEPILCANTIFDYSLYDETGNTTYITDKLNSYSLGINIFKLFDKVFNVNNKYLKYDEIDFSNYNYLYIYDFAPKYRFIKNSENDVYKFIEPTLKMYEHLKIILHTDFKKVSNMHDFSNLLINLRKVLFYDDINTYLLFQYDENNTISIINYNKEKINNHERLYEVINNDRKIKDVLVKTTYEEIRTNRYRLGFKLYQNKLKNTQIDINQIVDENTILINRLSSLNKTIEIEINKLMNK